MHLGRLCALVLVILALGSAVVPRRLAADPPPPPPPPPPYPTATAPVYQIISFDDTFVVGGPHPSQTIVINVGSLEGAASVEQTRFLVNEALSTIVLPEGRRNPTFEDLQDNSATVLGSFQTTDLAIHMVTPQPGAVPPEIQTRSSRRRTAPQSTRCSRTSSSPRRSRSRR